MLSKVSEPDRDNGESFGSVQVPWDIFDEALTPTEFLNLSSSSAVSVEQRQAVRCAFRRGEMLVVAPNRAGEAVSTWRACGDIDPLDLIKWRLRCVVLRQRPISQSRSRFRPRIGLRCD